jgi:hypothetical protein
MERVNPGITITELGADLGLGLGKDELGKQEFSRLRNRDFRKNGGGAAKKLSRGGPKPDVFSKALVVSRIRDVNSCDRVFELAHGRQLCLKLRRQ